MATFAEPDRGEGSDSEERLSQGRLRPGTYLVRIYVDRDGKLAKDFRAELNADDQVGEIRSIVAGNPATVA